ncbi:MAG: hypothetical protein P8R54_18390 [Myxococcota bacterium]|nr:hypothetical protein [Myxococcota bacterium]
MRRLHRQGRSASGSIMLIIVLMIGITAALYGPKWMDFMEMKEVARASAAEWHVTDNMAKGKVYFSIQLEERQMPLYIPDDACTFSKDQGFRYIECFWNADIEIPLIDKTIENSYEFTTEMAGTGKVRQW